MFGLCWVLVPLIAVGCNTEICVFGELCGFLGFYGYLLDLNNLSLDCIRFDVYFYL